MLLPIDIDSKLQIVEVIPEDKTRTNIVLSDNVGKQVHDFIEIIKYSDDLIKAGVDIKKNAIVR